MAQALHWKALTLASHDRMEEAFDCYLELVTRFKDAEDSILREYVVEALHAIGSRTEWAMRLPTVWDDLFDVAKRTPMENGAHQRCMAEALLKKAKMLHASGHASEACEVFRSLIRQFDLIPDPVLSARVVQAKVALERIQSGRSLQDM